MRIPLKKLISDNFTIDNKRLFYSIELIPKDDLEINFEKLKTMPLFVNFAWINDSNLIPSIRE
jgi:hypothetical protein